MTGSIAEQTKRIKTPDGGGDFLSFILRNRWLSLGLARLLAMLGKRRKKPISLGKTKLVLRHAHIVEALKRDADFMSSDGYEKTIGRTCGRFVLAMDRCPQLSLEQHGLYSALARYDLKALNARAAEMADRILDGSNGELDAIQDYLWPICGWSTQQMFGITQVDPVLFRQAVRSIFYHIFLDASKRKKEDAPPKPVELRAVEAGGMMKGWVSDEISRRRKAGPDNYGNDYLGLLMQQDGLDDDAVRRTLTGVLVGSVDTINGVAARTLKVLDSHSKLRARALDHIESLKRLNAYCLEAHRTWPQVPMMGRKAANTTSLGGTSIKQGNSLLLVTSAGMFDPDIFPHPTELRPDRPLDAYLHFGLGVHACSGRAMAELQVPMLIGKLLKRNYRVTGKMRWAGPFPNKLPIQIEGGR